LKNQIISVFEPIYLEILNYNMVGYANISARGMLDHLFETYSNITSVDLEINFEHMRRAWDPQQPVETIFKQIQVCADYSKAGGVLIGHPQHINVGYTKIFATGNFMSACRRWNEKPTAEKLDTIQIPLRSRSPSAQANARRIRCLSRVPLWKCRHDSDEYQMVEDTIGALANLATVTVSDRGVVAALTQENSRLSKQLEDNSSELRELKALLNQERRENRGTTGFNHLASNYCWSHGYKVGKTHTSRNFNTPKPSHKTEATQADNMGGSQANREWCLGAATLKNKTTLEVCQTPPLLKQHETAIVDSRCTGHFLLVNASCLNKVKSRNPLTMRLPSGATMEYSHTADLDIPELNAAASKAHVCPGMANHSLLSVGQLCDEGYIVTFKQDSVTICDSGDSQILSGS
jgi:hypothetical protein